MNFFVVEHPNCEIAQNTLSGCLPVICPSQNHAFHNIREHKFRNLYKTEDHDFGNGELCQGETSNIVSAVFFGGLTILIPELFFNFTLEISA